MVTLACTTSRHDGVTLVTAHLRDLDGPTRVRVENRLDGPVWPPRSEGLPEAGWTDEGFAGVVEPGAPALGYASPAPPREAPAVLVEAEPAPDADREATLTDGPAAVVRELGDPSPPADAVRTATARDEASEAGPNSTAGANRREPVAEHGPQSDPSDAEVPDALGPWLAEMARRVDRAESLAAAETLPEATEAVREAGGLAGVRELADDERRLRVVAERVRRLAERRAAAEIPVDALERLA